MLCYDNQQKSRTDTIHNRSLFKKPVFTHGQLYVAISRVTSNKGLKILIENEDGTCTDTTKNIVYPEVFSAMNSSTNL